MSAGHPLTSAAGIEILLRGGNAFDAGVAAILVGGVVEQDLFSLGGESLVLVYPVKEKKVTSIVGPGLGAEGRVDRVVQVARQDAGRRRPRSVASCPGSLHGALTVLEKWGTMSFEQVSARAIAYAEQRLPDAAEDGRHDRAQPRVLQGVAGQSALLAQARRLDVQAGRDDQAADARRTR